MRRSPPRPDRPDSAKAISIAKNRTDLPGTLWYVLWDKKYTTTAEPPFALVVDAVEGAGGRAQRLDHVGSASSSSPSVTASCYVAAASRRPGAV
ncbi:hypothetical protein [Streptomyces vastus]|uniref:Uncharacterized protein n=1 Tax=Streptomyces vastus TaxID=285451 RepID=A0ABN3R5F3_9ACTN